MMKEEMALQLYVLQANNVHGGKELHATLRVYMHVDESEGLHMYILWHFQMFTLSPHF